MSVTYLTLTPRQRLTRRAFVSSLEQRKASVDGPKLAARTEPATLSRLEPERSSSDHQRH